jgi:hypothetical protein
MPFKTTSTEASNTTSGMLLPWFYCWPLYNMCTGIKHIVLPTMIKLSTMLLQVLLTTCSWWAAQPCSRLSISTRNKWLIFSIFTRAPLCFLLQIQKPTHFKYYLDSWVHNRIFYILLYSIYHIGCRRSIGKDCPICPKYKSITANYILESCTAFNETSLSNFMLSESVKFIYSSILLFDEAIF